MNRLYLNHILYWYHPLNLLNRMLCIFNANSWSMWKWPKRRKGRKHKARSARAACKSVSPQQRALAGFCRSSAAAGVTWLQHGALQTSVLVRADGETGITDCVFVKNSARACRRCCRSSSAKEPWVTVTAAHGTARRQRSCGKTVSTSKYYTCGYKRAINCKTSQRHTAIFFCSRWCKYVRVYDHHFIVSSLAGRSVIWSVLMVLWTLALSRTHTHTVLRSARPVSWAHVLCNSFSAFMLAQHLQVLTGIYLRVHLFCS